jgi:flagellar biosynthetic protein FliR
MTTAYIIGVQVFFLIFARVLGFFIVSPFWSNPLFFFRFKNLLILFMSYLLLPLVELQLHLKEPMVYSFFWYFFIKNLLIGMGIGFFIYLLFAIFDIVGELWGIQIGFSISQLFDPMTGNQSPVMSQMVSFFALAIFVAFNGHLKIIELLSHSFIVAPVTGDLKGFSELLTSFIEGMLVLFKGSVVLSLTLMGSIFIATLFIGLLAKAAPQLNVMMFGMPTYVILGFILLIYFMPNFVYFVSNYIQNMLEIISKWMQSIGKA